MLGKRNLSRIPFCSLHTVTINSGFRVQNSFYKYTLFGRGLENYMKVVCCTRDCFFRVVSHNIFCEEVLPHSVLCT